MSAQATQPRPKPRINDNASTGRGPGSLSDIARRAGICRSHLFRIMDGSRIPSLPVAWKLAQALRISLDELYGRLMKVKARRKSATPIATTNQRPETLPGAN